MRITLSNLPFRFVCQHGPTESGTVSPGTRSQAGDQRGNRLQSLQIADDHYLQPSGPCEIDYFFTSIPKILQQRHSRCAKVVTVEKDAAQFKTGDSEPILQGD